MWRALQSRRRASGSRSKTISSAPSASAIARTSSRSPSTASAVPVASTMRHGASGSDMPGVGVDRLDDPGVHQLDPRHAGAGADDGRRGRARRLDVGEAHPQDDGVLGNRLQPQRQLGDHGKRPLRADEEPGEVVAGGGLAGARAGADDAAVRRARPRAPAGCRASSRSAPSSCPPRSSPPCLRAWRRRPGRPGRRARARRRRARASAASRPPTPSR